MPNKFVNAISERRQVALWMGTTVVFALLFFLSAVLDMKVRVTFGQSTGATGTTTSVPVQSAPSGIANQVGGC